MSKHVTCVVLSISSFHTAVPALQFLLQPTVPDVQMFHPSNCSLVTKCSSDISIRVQDNWQKTHTPQNSRLYCVNPASFNNSLMLMISLSPLLCNRQPPTIKYPPSADFLSISSQTQSPSRCLSILSCLPVLDVIEFPTRVMGESFNSIHPSKQANTAIIFSAGPVTCRYKAISNSLQ